MALINTSVPNLIQGVSQQPDATRFDGQCEEQENALSSVADGLKKRPNTRHVARLLEEAISSDAKVHFINRTEDEKYVAIHDGTLRIFNLETGVEATITDDTSGSNYLNVSNPKEDLEMMTVADYTFVVNKTETVEEDTVTTPDYSNEALIFIKNIGYFQHYTVTIDGSSTEVTTGTSDKTENGDSYWNGRVATGHGDEALNIDTLLNNNMVNYGGFTSTKGLLRQLNDRTGITATFIGDKTGLVEGHTSISVGDSVSGSGIGLVYKTVESITSLPLTGSNGLVVKVAGDSELNQDDYYVKFVTTDNSATGRGYWEETIAPLTSVGIKASTAPHQLINTGENTFTLQLSSFGEREAGDNDTNPHPSFIGKQINSVFFFKNRLGFITGESIIMSEAGHFFNFYRKTVTTLLDDAPIDISVASTKVTKLKSAIGFQGNLVLFSDNQQFILKGGDILTPKTVSISESTSFDSADSVKPLALGSYIYFPFTRGNYTGVRELSVSKNTDNYDATEVTEHVPAYVPKNIVEMVGTSSEDIIALVSEDESNAIYIYNYFWNNNQKVLSAWSKFTFTGEIRGIEFIESTLCAVITNNGETNLVEMPLESGLSDNAGYVTHLDSRVASTVTNGSSTITLPYTPEDNSVEVYTTDGLKLNCTNWGATVTLAQAVNDVDENGDPIDTDVWIGIPYTMKYTFSEQLFKAKAGNGKSPSNAAKMRIRNGSIYYADSAYFKVKVTPKYRDTYENVFTPDVVGSSTIGSLSLDSGFYRFPVFTKPQDTTITIENESALPSTFQSAEFESFVHSRSNRYG